MTETFGHTRQGALAHLYTICGWGLTAKISDYGATLVRLLVPDQAGCTADVVLGFSCAAEYEKNSGCVGATVGRNANRVGNASFSLHGRRCQLPQNEGKNNLHSGPDMYYHRLWQVLSLQENSICLGLDSPDGDQGFPGHAEITVTYTLEENGLTIRYHGVCDQDTVFNMTNHSYFNLAGHDRPERAMAQLLTLRANHFTPADGESIPTGVLEAVERTPMDFTNSKPLGQDIGADYIPLHLQKGYDHNFALRDHDLQIPVAILQDPASGRTMAVYTDCPGLQLYTANCLPNCAGKDGAQYTARCAVCLETQFFPDSVNKPQWKSPVVPAGKPYDSVTIYRFLAK